MGTENRARPTFPMTSSTTPFVAPPPTGVPFSSSRPVVGSEAPGFRPAAPAVPQTTAPPVVSGSQFGSQLSGLRPGPPAPYEPSTTGPFQSFSTPSFTSAPQVPPVGQPPFQPPAAQISSVPPFRPQPPSVSSVPPFRPQPPSVPTGSPPVNLNAPQPGPDSSVFRPSPNFQPSFPVPDSS